MAATSSTGAFSFGDLVPLIVAIIGTVSAIAIAIWNTRGESAALRRLKAMNEALEGLKDSGEVREAFKAARDVLAVRMANRVTGPSWWRKFGSWLLGVAIGVAVALASWGLTLILPGFDEASAAVTYGVAIASTLIGAVASVVAATSTRRYRRLASWERLQRNQARMLATALERVYAENVKLREDRPTGDGDETT